jgi:hypothetical protein
VLPSESIYYAMVKTLMHNNIGAIDWYMPIATVTDIRLSQSYNLRCMLTENCIKIVGDKFSLIANRSRFLYGQCGS